MLDIYQEMIFNKEYWNNMKKLLYVLVVVLGLSSCTYTRIEHRTTDDGRNVQIVNKTHNIRYVEFDEHEYVYYQAGHRGSMCHSPKCKCLNKYKK